jgi:hypothetical protein
VGDLKDWRKEELWSAMQLEALDLATRSVVRAPELLVFVPYRAVVLGKGNVVVQELLQRPDELGKGPA